MINFLTLASDFIKFNIFVEQLFKNEVTYFLIFLFLFLYFSTSILSYFFIMLQSGLQPVPEYLYYTDPHNTPSKSFALQPLPVLTSHFYPLFCWNSPPFLHSPYSPPSRAILYFHSYLNSSSFQTVLGSPSYFDKCTF